MALFWYVSLVALIYAQNVSSIGPDEVPFTPVVDAVERRAVCMDGSPAGYHLATGNGDGANNWIVYLKDISSFLPMSCTYKIDPSLCLFPEYLVGDVQTPLFLLNSAFDLYQVDNMLVPRNATNWIGWHNGLRNLTNSPPTQTQLIKDFVMAFLNAITEIPDNPSRGLFIYPCLVHTVTTSSLDTQSTIDAYWNPNSTIKLQNMTILQAVSNWYFDRGTVKLIGNAKFPQC